MLEFIDQELEALKKAGLYRELKVIDRSKIIIFCSNDYLGLANHPKVIKKATGALKKFGAGAGASRLISGNTIIHEELEKKLARFKKREAAIVFPTGYMANLGTISALTNEKDTIIIDRLNHASIIDACRLTKAKFQVYPHKDMATLEKILKRSEIYKKRLIITDSIFSMDGDIAPLDKIYEVSSKYGAMLMVDDAHGEGVLGNSGRGIVDHFGLHGKVDVEVGTMSKAFGVMGGLAAGKKEVIEWLSQRGRPFLFSSAMTIPDVAACIAAVGLLEKSENLVKKLWENADYLRAGLKKLGFDTGISISPIIPVMLGENKLAQDMSRELFAEGLFAKAIVYPTVPQGKARIRVMNSAGHSREQLDQALKIFEKVGKKMNVI